MVFGSLLEGAGHGLGEAAGEIYKTTYRWFLEHL
jgi:hypothetical protein